SFHYNSSENFVPSTNRVNQYGEAIASPTGVGKDYGVTVNLWDNKFIARLNWYETRIAGATVNVSTLFNQINEGIFKHYGVLLAEVRRLDANDDGRIDDAIRS